MPQGFDFVHVADQPKVVDHEVSEFVESLAEALAMTCSPAFRLGWRTGTVVALSIPLVLAVTFFLMRVFAIDLQRVSLGALIIALGLLVDDAIIAVEMMVVKMEQGWDRFQAATFAYTSTAFPMLTGTLITAAAFTPVGFARSSAGEYTFSIFSVVTIALLVSWVVAVVFTPYLGYQILDPVKLAAVGAKHGGDIYPPFYRRFKSLVVWCLRRRWLVIFATLAIFVASIAVFATVVKKQFFPDSSRPELPDRTLAAARRFAQGHRSRGRARRGVAQGRPGHRIGIRLCRQQPAPVLPAAQPAAVRRQLRPVHRCRQRTRRTRRSQRRLEARFADGDGSWSGLRARVLRLENGRR